MITNYVRPVCGNCQHWGGNNQKPISSTGGSKCAIHKQTSYSFQYCTSSFEELALRKGK